MTGDGADDEHPILALRDVRWLRGRCPEGVEVTDVISEVFLDQVHPEVPVVLLRLHAEPHPDVPGGRVAVVLAGFPMEDGRAMINEFACHHEDLLRVLKSMKLPFGKDPDEEPEVPPPAPAPWEVDEERWRELLGGEPEPEPGR